MDAAIIADWDARYAATNAGSAACVDGDGVFNWKDQSPSLFNFKQNTAGFRPLWKANVFGTQPGILFDGVDDLLPVAGGISALDNFSVFVVHKPDAAIGANKFLLYDGVSSFLLDNNAAANWGGQILAGGGTSGFITGTNGTAMISSLIRSSTISSVGLTGARLRLGDQPAPTTSPGVNFYCGADGGGGSFFKGHITRILIFNRALTEKQRFSVEAQLATLYGLTMPTVIPLDRNITIEAGKTYTASVYDISAANAPLDALLNNPMLGSWDAFTTLAAIAAPLYAAPFAIKVSDLALELWRVVAISESERNIYEITALKYNASKYAAVDTGALLDSPITSALATPYFVVAPTSPAVAITYVQLSQNLVQETLELTWVASTDPLVLTYEVAYRKDLANWVRFNVDSGACNASIAIFGFGSYEFQIRAVNRNGARSQPANTSFNYTQTLVTTPSVSPGSATFLYGTPPVLSVLADAGAVIRYTIDGTDPTPLSPIWPGGVGAYITLTLPNANVVLKVVAYIGAFASAINTLIYTITSSASTPTCANVSLTKSTYYGVAGNISAACATSGAVIKYIKNAGPLTTYTVPVPLARFDYFQAYATKPGLNDSPASTYDNTDPSL